MRRSCSACFSACMRRRNSRAQESGWRPCNASSAGTADASGRRARWIMARRSTSPLQTRSLSMSNEVILLVEDNPDDETLTLRALHKNNIMNTVVVARDGAEALDYLFARGSYADRDAADLPQLVLLDLNLPKIGGVEVLRQIRAEERLKLLAGFTVGANSYVVKPVDLVEFSEAVRQLGLYWLILNQRAPAVHASNG